MPQNAPDRGARPPTKTPPRPVALIPEPDGIPVELRQRDRWVVWRYELKPDWKADDRKPWTKVPYRSDGKGKAASNRPETWSDFEAAQRAYDTGEYDGFGFVTGDGIAAGDVDDCRDGNTGELTPEAERIITLVKTYTEVSPSGQGGRFWAFTDREPGARKRRGNVELYPSKQYLTVTGHHVDGTPATIENRTAELVAIHDEYLAPKAKPRGNGTPRKRSTSSGPQLDDEQVLAAMTDHKPALGKLFEDDASEAVAAYLRDHDDDHSAADLALVSHLAWWSNYDAEQVDRLFRTSALMRPKWDQQRGELTYGERTITTAFEGHAPGDGYTPGMAPTSRDPTDPGPSDSDVPEQGAAARRTVIAEPEPASDWPDPGPLPRGAPPVPKIDPELLPKPLREWAEDLAQRASVPLDSFVPGILVTLGATLGNRWRIRPKQHDPWTVVPNLYGALVQPSGQMKTHVLDSTVEPLRRIETELRDRFEAGRIEDEVAQEVLQAQVTAAQDQLKRAIRDNDLAAIEQHKSELVKHKQELENSRVVAPTILVNDPTTEVLVELMRDNPRGLLLSRDELHGWYANLHKQGREGDRSLYLEAHDGDRRYSQHRIKRGHTEAPIMTLSILGGIQPSRLQAIQQGAITGDDADGLLQRFQALVWPDEMPPYALDDRPRRDDLDQRVASLYWRLYELNPARYGYDDGAPGITRFDSDAQPMFYRWLEVLENDIRSPETQAKPAWASYLGKTRSLMPSIALMLHLVDLVLNHTSTVSVSPDATHRAARLTDYLAGHAAKLYSPELHREQHTARLLIEKIAGGQVKDGMKVRDIYNAGWSGLGRVEVEHALAVLEHLHWARVERVTPSKSGGRPSAVVRLRPDIDELVEEALA